MSSHRRLLEADERILRREEREMGRQMRHLELHLQYLREELPLSCPHQPDPESWETRALTTRLDVEQELGSMQRKLNWMLDPSHDNKLLALVDVEGFVPKEITVTVEDGKVEVFAEHKEERTTSRGKEYNYRTIVREISLPPGVREDEVTYSLGSDNVVKIKAAHKCFPCLPSQ